jgi:hypothetical protein
MASKRQLELMDQKQRLNTYISEARAKLDDAARGSKTSPRPPRSWRSGRRWRRSCRASWIS